MKMSNNKFGPKQKKKREIEPESKKRRGNGETANTESATKQWNKVSQTDQTGNNIFYNR